MITKCFGCSYYKAVGYKNTIDDFVNHYNVSMIAPPEWCPFKPYKEENNNEIRR